jgi:predicted transposase YbfD/YdcC
VHLLSAFSHQDHTTLAQAPVPEKENEIPALPQLLGPLPLDDVVVTADALHTQRDTARFLVTQKGADYLLVVKDNQPTLHRHLQRLLPQSAFSPSTHPGC